MPISLSRGDADDHVVVVIDGRFTVDVKQDFLDVVQPLAGTARHVTVDLRAAEQMDCAGLGLLVQLYDKLRNSDVLLRVTKGSPVEDILTVANFDKLFAIEAA